MDPLRLLHSSDLHLGKRFSTYPEPIRGRLIEARHEALNTLARVARSEGAAHILLAGDTFDTETPSESVRVQALAAMAEPADVTWWLLPGNHDSLRAEPLWDAVRRDAPPNVRVLDQAAPVALSEKANLLPAPLPHRFPGIDLTAQMVSMTTPEGHLRIGLAHGATSSFHPEADTSAVIPPDRAQTAGLDYLALGDWHGTLSIGPRTRYSGTPERDRHRHNGKGVCLLVEVSDAYPPRIQEVETGRFNWQSIELVLAPDEDGKGALGRAVSEMTTRRDTLAKITASGLLTIADRAHLENEIARIAPSFGWLEADLTSLSTLATAGDLDEIAQGGALRAAADDLLNAAHDPSSSEDDRRIASRALDRLWTLLQEAD